MVQITQVGLYFKLLVQITQVGLYFKLLVQITEVGLYFKLLVQITQVGLYFKLLVQITQVGLYFKLLVQITQAGRYFILFVQITQVGLYFKLFVQITEAGRSQRHGCNCDRRNRHIARPGCSGDIREGSDDQQGAEGAGGRQDLPRDQQLRRVLREEGHRPGKRVFRERQVFGHFTA